MALLKGLMASVGPLPEEFFLAPAILPSSIVEPGLERLPTAGLPKVRHSEAGDVGLFGVAKWELGAAAGGGCWDADVATAAACTAAGLCKDDLSGSLPSSSDARFLPLLKRSGRFSLLAESLRFALGDGDGLRLARKCEGGAGKWPRPSPCDGGGGRKSSLGSWCCAPVAVAPLIGVSMPEVSALRSWLFGVALWMGLPRPPPLPPPPNPPCDEFDLNICAAAAALTGCFDLLREECWKCG